MPDNRNASEASRDKYRDDDDERVVLHDDEDAEIRPDTKTEARGDAREAIGNNARDTDAAPTGPEGNDGTRRPNQR
jgi:hypothetical protein